MNPHIKAIINIQFDEFKKYETADIGQLGDDDVFIKRESDGLHMVTSAKPNEGSFDRLRYIIPIFGDSISKYVPIGDGIIINLGDLIARSYNTKYPVLCFSKIKDVNAITIPNVDFFTNYLQNTFKQVENDIPFHKKESGSIFSGASTGNLDNNTRTKYALSCVGNDRHHGYLSHICQWTMQEWLDRYPTIQSLVRGQIPLSEQLRYKIVVNIDGNTLCWSRLYWQMKSNSIPVYINPNKEHVQFFDYINKDDCYISSSLDDCFNTYDYILDSKNAEHVAQVIQNGKKYCDNLFNGFIENKQAFLQNIVDSILIKFFHT
jgi:hypothetical protein